MTIEAKPDAKEGQLEADAWEETTRDNRRRTETLRPSRPLSKERDEGKGRIIYKAYDKTRAEQTSETADKKEGNVRPRDPEYKGSSRHKTSNDSGTAPTTAERNRSKIERNAFIFWKGKISKKKKPSTTKHNMLK